MTTITAAGLSVSPLPRPPPPYDDWVLNSPNYITAYNTILNAERHAVTQAAPFNKKARQNVMFARLAGYLLLELFYRRGILTEGPCRSIATQINKPSRGNSTDLEVVFEVGEWQYKYFIRMCAFDLFPTSFGTSVSLQFEQLQQVIRHPPLTLHAPNSTRWKSRQGTA
jgi:hypothetical protein